jgi:hypothetical protein
MKQPLGRESREVALVHPYWESVEKGYSRSDPLDASNRSRANDSNVTM